MNIYKIIVQYKGTAYSGFQVQLNERTIQGEINQALKVLSKTDSVKSIGSGRTDAGVHALAQVMRVEIPVDIPEESFHKALNAHLPDDIRVIQASKCRPDFHPIFSAKSKEYNYIFANTPTLSPFASELVTHFPHSLNIDRMREGCAVFKGEHDFKNFQCTGTVIENTVRQIVSCDIIKYNSTGHWSHLAPEYYVLEVVGTGFLKQMVRLMMGALWNLGMDKITLNELKDSLKEGFVLSRRLGPTAPPQGLYLKEVHY